MAKTSSTRIKRRASHSKIETYDESYCEDAIGRIVLDFSKSRGREFTEVKSHGVQLLKRTDRGDLLEAQIYLKPPIIMSNSRKASLQQATQKWDDDRAWSSRGLKTDTEMYERSGRPDETSWRIARQVRPDHEEILLDGTAQSVRNGETLRDRSGRPDNIFSQEVERRQIFVMGNDETELELSVESRSFVNRVNDQVRKRQKRISNVTGDGEKLSMIWRMFMALTMESAVFMGKNSQNNRHSIANTTDLTLKQMFHISTKLVSEQDEISGLETIGWENHSWKYL